MAVSRKITSKVSIAKKVIDSPKPAVVEEPVEEVPSEKVSEKTSLGDKPNIERRRICYFCQSKKTPSYTDMVTLKRYINERSKIVSALKSGVCSRHQRAITRGIKYARHLSLLPFTPKV